LLLFRAEVDFMHRQEQKEHAPSSDSARSRPGGQLGEKPAPHTQTPPNKPGQFDEDDQRKVRSEEADAGVADEQVGREDQRAEPWGRTRPTRH
jgi:hypothetical protein